jgi:hypothetical protein
MKMTTKINDREPWWLEFVDKWNHKYPTTPLYDTMSCKFYVKRAVRFILTNSIDVDNPSIWPIRDSGPLEIIIHCPKCGQQHIDQPESHVAWERRLQLQENADPERWTNPPHKTHLCIYCWHKFKPMNVHTTGVPNL